MWVMVEHRQSAPQAGLSGQLTPFTHQLGGQIDRTRLSSLRYPMRSPFAPTSTIKIFSNGLRNEPTDRRIRVTVARVGLATVEKPKRNDEIKLIFSPRHCHIQ